MEEGEALPEPKSKFFHSNMILDILMSGIMALEVQVCFSDESVFAFAPFPGLGQTSESAGQVELPASNQSSDKSPLN